MTAAATVMGRPLFTVRDLEIRPRIMNKYLAKGLIAPGELSVIYGEPGSGKSFLALYIGYMISMKWPLFGRRVRCANVLYLALEGHAGFERRIDAAIKTWARSAGFYYISDSVNLFSGLGHAEAIIDAAAALGACRTPAGLIIIDTLARAMREGNENEPDDMGALIDAFDVIRRESGAAVMVVHHSGKDSSRGMRGHSSLLAAADLAIEVKKEADGTRSFRIAKSKDGIDGETFQFKLEPVDLGQDDDGDKITSCVVREASQPAADKMLPGKKPSPKALAFHRALIDALASQGQARREAAGCHSVTMVEWEQACITKGVIDPAATDNQRRALISKYRLELVAARWVVCNGNIVWNRAGAETVAP